MKSLRFLERGENRKAMKVTKVRRRSSRPMGTTKCMRVKRTSIIHSWGSISGHADYRCGKLIRCMRRNISNRRRRLRPRFEKSEISVDISCLGECRHDISLRLSVRRNFGFLSVFSAKFRRYIGFLPIFFDISRNIDHCS